MTWTAALFFCALLSVSLVTAVGLAPRNHKTYLAALVVLGFITSLAKIWLCQQMPQWLDTNSDSLIFHLNALAYTLHWSGLAVSATDFSLRGLLYSGVTVWSADSSVPYSAVTGSVDWLYGAIVGGAYQIFGVEQQHVIYANAALVAFYPVSAFGIAFYLSGNRSIANLATIVTLLDPTTGVNASWLMKDSLVGFLAMAALWAAATVVKREVSLSSPAILALALALLGVTRFVAFFAMVLAVIVAMTRLLLDRDYRVVASIAIATCIGIAMMNILYHAPYSMPNFSLSSTQALPRSQSQPIVSTIIGGLDTLNAQSGDSTADSTTLLWKSALRDDFVLAGLKSVAHTLFAPYPWVALYPGLTYRHFSELYYPGMVLWIVCLPGLFVAVAKALRQGDPTALLVLVFLGATLIAYTVFQGEWSTRQRGFALPALFSMAAWGWADILTRVRKARL